LLSSFAEGGGSAFRFVVAIRISVGLLLFGLGGFVAFRISVELLLFRISVGLQPHEKLTPKGATAPPKAGAKPERRSDKIIAFALVVAFAFP
jgi:hypothetical protein